MSKFGVKAFYGDAANLDLLHAAGIAEARVLAIAIDDFEATLRLVEQVRARYPGVRILARAYDRVHAYKLIHRGVAEVYVETSGSALAMGMDALRALGVSAHQAHRVGSLFRRRNERSIAELARVYHESDEAGFLNQARGWLAQFEKMLSQDLAATHDDAPHTAWSSARPSHPGSPESN
jgi:voltage-gated potassium channel Kch